MATISKEILESLGDVVKQFHTALAKGGAEGIQAELANCKWSNPFGMGIILSKWNDILYDLDNVASKLKKGNSDDVIKALTGLSKSIADLQLFILKSATEVGSFIPGPIGIVCSLVLSIGCFAVGDVPGGFLNLLGAIPGAKFAKYLKIGSLRMSILNFKDIISTKWGYKVLTLTQKADRHSKNFRYVETFDGYFANTLKRTKQELSKIGSEISNIKERINLSSCKDHSNLLGNQNVRNGDEWAHEYKYVLGDY